jgi:hypothetical protein
MLLLLAILLLIGFGVWLYLRPVCWWMSHTLSFNLLLLLLVAMVTVVGVLVFEQ